MERWVGRVAIVTGASAGIGVEIARLLVQNGMKVVGVARRIDMMKKLAVEVKDSQGEFYALQCDVSKEEDVLRVMKWTKDKLGGTDVLVNNAGVFRNAPLTDFTTSDLQLMLDVNVFGLCLFTREVIKDLRNRGIDDGHIFHINSISGQQIVNFPGVYPYAATKHAVTVLTEGLRRELRDLGSKIRITSISPGAVRTEILLASGMSPEVVKNHYESSSCLESEDIAKSLLHALTSPPHVQVHEITIMPVGQKL